MDSIKKSEDQIIQNNKILIEKYPFLLPRNVFTDKVDEDYDYHYTLFDEIPEGWRKNFGIELCEELRKQLIKENNLYKLRFTQIKEKYGTLRLYINSASHKVFKILEKYEMWSENICIKCGKPATKISLGWISPYCNKCAKKLPTDATVDIDEYKKIINKE